MPGMDDTLDPGERTPPEGIAALAPADADWSDMAATAPGARCAERARRIRGTRPVKSTAQRMFKVPTVESALRATAHSERKVASELGKLRAAWRVLHSVPVGADRPEISHLVIGPTGVFTIASRSYGTGRPPLFTRRVLAYVVGDEIRIHGESATGYVPQARAQAWRTARALSSAAGIRVLVRPAVVIVGIDDVRIHRPPDRVEVLHRRLLVEWLTRFPAALDNVAIDRLFTAARRSDTWTA